MARSIIHRHQHSEIFIIHPTPLNQIINFKSNERNSEPNPLAHECDEMMMKNVMSFLIHADVGARVAAAAQCSV
jgi:hypothetical protein